VVSPVEKETSGNFIFRKHWQYPSSEAETESLISLYSQRKFS